MLSFEVIGISKLTGNFSLDIEVSAYGYVAVKERLDPCKSGLDGMCGMQPGSIELESNIVLEDDVKDMIPGIAYTIPDLDATVRISIASDYDPNVKQACVEARLSNGKTVEQSGVSWATAVIAGLALVVSAVVAGLGHDNTASHIAAYALALFSYFQAMAIVGLMAVPLPPIVQSWTQNFQWTMGIIEVGFLQTIATWYQKSTGGTPATILQTLTTTSVQVQKRSLPHQMGKRAIESTIALLEKAHDLSKRSNNENTINSISGTYIVKGIDRVAFRAGMEATNVFLTGLIFFCVFVVVTVLCVAAFKGFCELAVKMGRMKSGKFQDFRNGWLVVLKGIMFRLVLIGFPQMTILCLWEFTQVDSPAEVVLAVFFFFGMAITLGWASWKVIAIARRSIAMHKNPAYILFSDPTALNKWGFLYVQFRATAYYYIVPVLAYILVKGMFIAFGQGSGAAQAIGILIVEAAYLIAASVMRPWMDKKTNTVFISICSINFVNAIFTLLFSNVFDQPAIVSGVVGVVFFVMNAAFALILLILVIVSSVLASIRKDPDTRYQAMTDDRASFIKSQTQLTTELDALGATARGDAKGGFKGLDLDDDNDSWESGSMRRHASGVPSTTGMQQVPPKSPVDPSVPLFPNSQNHSPYGDSRVYQGSYTADRPPSNLSNTRGVSPSPYAPRQPTNMSSTSLAAPAANAFGQQRTASPLGYSSQTTARYVYQDFMIK
jgi:hypothetical protein